MDHTGNQSDNQSANRRDQPRQRAPSNTGEGGYRRIARQAVDAETEVKVQSGGLTASTTVVGEQVTYTQNFNF